MDGIRLVLRLYLTFWPRQLFVLLTGQRFGRDDVVGPYPSRRANRETSFRPRGQFARSLPVAAQIGRLRRRQVGLRIIALPTIGHRQLAETERCLALARHRRSQDR